MTSPPVLSFDWSRLLRELRRESGISQHALSLRSGISQRTISDYEDVSTCRQLSIYKVEKLIHVLGYEIDVFLRSK